eukprot:962726-Rhodomonas_salina.1
MFALGRGGGGRELEGEGGRGDGREEDHDIRGATSGNCLVACVRVSLHLPVGEKICQKTFFLLRLCKAAIVLFPSPTLFH